MRLPGYWLGILRQPDNRHPAYSSASLFVPDRDRMESEGKPSSIITGDPGRFRRLGGDELVSRGDFVENEQRQLTQWEGPTGFRASSFVHPVYRVSASDALPK